VIVTRVTVEHEGCITSMCWARWLTRLLTPTTAAHAQILIVSDAARTPWKNSNAGKLPWEFRIFARSIGSTGLDLRSSQRYNWA
jgi:hypothetical protein